MHQHVGLGIHADHGPYPRRDGHGELTGAAAEIEGDIVTGQPARAGKRVEHLARISPPVPLIEPGGLAAEAKILAHGASLHRGSLAGTAVPLAAARLPGRAASVFARRQNG